MECRYLHVCVVFAALIIGGSYAYGWGRGHGHHREPDQRFYGGVHHGYGGYGGYGGGFHHPPRHGYIQGGIYNHESSDDEHSSSDEEEHEEEHHEEEDHRVWRFQISDDNDPYAYAYTDANGHVHGFVIDLMRAICERAHKTCHFVVDTSTHCWRTDGERELPGIGLMDHYYDGCLGYWQSAPRRNSFNFSLPFTSDVRSSLHYKAGEKIENPRTVSGKKIGFVGGWPLSKKCFEHQAGFVGNKPGQYEPHLYETHQSMVDALKRGELNAILTVDTPKDESLGIEHSGPYFHCTEAGASLMAMYGSEVLGWWNHAFQEMRHDGSFRRLCQTAARVHAAQGEINCLR